MLDRHYEDVSDDLRTALVELSVRSEITEKVLTGKLMMRQAPIGFRRSESHNNVLRYLAGMIADIESVVSAYQTWANTKLEIPPGIWEQVDYPRRPSPGTGIRWYYERTHPHAPEDWTGYEPVA